jgi:hypothetical protein
MPKRSPTRSDIAGALLDIRKNEAADFFSPCPHPSAMSRFSNLRPFRSWPFGGFHESIENLMSIVCQH